MAGPPAVMIGAQCPACLTPAQSSSGAGPIFQRPSPADLLTGAAQSKDEVTRLPERCCNVS